MGGRAGGCSDSAVADGRVVRRGWRVEWAGFKLQAEHCCASSREAWEDDVRFWFPNEGVSVLTEACLCGWPVNIVGGLRNR